MFPIFVPKPLKWVTIPKRLEHLCLVCKTMNVESLPPDINNTFYPFPSTHTHAHIILSVPIHHTDFMTNSFTVEGERLYGINSQENLRVLEIRLVFKSRYLSDKRIFHTLSIIS